MSDSVRPHRRQPTRLPVPGLLQARIMEWVVISFSNAWMWKVKVKSLSRVRLLATSWAAAYQAPPSMGFSRQEYWSGVPLPSPPPTLSPWQNCLPRNLVLVLKRLGTTAGESFTGILASAPKLSKPITSLDVARCPLAAQLSLVKHLFTGSVSKSFHEKGRNEFTLRWD